MFCFLLPFRSCLLLYKCDSHVNSTYYAYCTKSYFIWFSLPFFDANLKIRYKKVCVTGGQYTCEALKDMMRACGLLYLAALGFSEFVNVCGFSAFIKRVELWVSEQPSKSYQAETSWLSISAVPVSILGKDTGSLEVVLGFLRVSRKMPGNYTFPVYCSRFGL